MKSLYYRINCPQAYGKFPLLDIFIFIVDLSNSDRRTNEKEITSFFPLLGSEIIPTALQFN